MTSADTTGTPPQPSAFARDAYDLAQEYLGQGRDRDAVYWLGRARAHGHPDAAAAYAALAGMHEALSELDEVGVVLNHILDQAGDQ